MRIDCLISKVSSRSSKLKPVSMNDIMTESEKSSVLASFQKHSAPTKTLKKVARGVRLIDISLKTNEFINSLVLSALKNFSQ